MRDFLPKGITQVSGVEHHEQSVEQRLRFEVLPEFYADYLF
jgi:hypothetical protein